MLTGPVYWLEIETLGYVFSEGTWRLLVNITCTGMAASTCSWREHCKSAAVIIREGFSWPDQYSGFRPEMHARAPRLREHIALVVWCIHTLELTSRRYSSSIDMMVRCLKD
jgi:hypothetical protein